MSMVDGLGVWLIGLVVAWVLLSGAVNINLEGSQTFTSANNQAERLHRDIAPNAGDDISSFFADTLGGAGDKLAEFMRDATKNKI